MQIKRRLFKKIYTYEIKVNTFVLGNIDAYKSELFVY